MIKDLQHITCHIREVADFPKPGILFKDIAPLLAERSAFSNALDHMCEMVSDRTIHRVAAPEARGFIFGVAVAERLGVGFVPIRKPGKLPYDTASKTYELEYGQDTIEMHVDAVGPGDHVLLVDDVLATGGTMRACAELVAEQGASIATCMFLLELEFLKGREQLKDYRVRSLIRE